MTISFLIPMFFIQKGTSWNTIQFFYYFLFFSNLFFAQFLTSFLKNKNIIKIIILILFILIANIGTIATLKDYLGNPPPSALPQTEVEALNFLKNQPDGLVLTYPYDKYLKNNLTTPIPLYAYETTGYVPLFQNILLF
jgi:hypothetical protein